MNIEQIREFCLSKKGVEESFPFDAVTLVFKVMGKMFALANLNGDLSVNLKCDPEKAIELREEHSAIRPGWHMNKKHWNTVDMNGSLSPEFIQSLINHSYELVVQSLTRKLKDELNSL